MVLVVGISGSHLRKETRFSQTWKGAIDGAISDSTGRELNVKMFEHLKLQVSLQNYVHHLANTLSCGQPSLFQQANPLRSNLQEARSPQLANRAYRFRFYAIKSLIFEALHSDAVIEISIQGGSRWAFWDPLQTSKTMKMDVED